MHSTDAVEVHRPRRRILGYGRHVVAQKPSASALPADLALKVQFGVGANLSVADASGTRGAVRRG